MVPSRVTFSVAEILDELKTCRHRVAFPVAELFFTPKGPLWGPFGVKNGTVAFPGAASF